MLIRAMITADASGRKGNSPALAMSTDSLLAGACNGKNSAMAKRRYDHLEGDTAARLALARERQELAMRWVLLVTIVVSVLLSNLATLFLGAPSLHIAMVQGAWVTLLGWLVRRVFS
jgi:hypothetical protein